MKPSGRAHHAVFKACALLIADAVERRQLTRSELACLFEHLIDQVLVDLLIATQFCKLGDHRPEHGLHVIERRAVDGHSFAPDGT